MDEKSKLSYAEFLLIQYVFWFLDRLEKQRPGGTVAEISEVLKQILMKQPEDYGSIFY